MSLKRLWESGWDYFGTNLVGLPSEDIPEGSILEDIASENPGSLVRGYIVFQSGAAFFNENGSYEMPALPALVIVALYVDGVFIENRQYAIGPQPLIVSTGRKTHMSAGV